MKRYLARALPASLLLLAALPGGATAHVLAARYQAPLPLAVYVAGAAIAVAMSFAFVTLRNPQTLPTTDRGAARTSPGWLRGGLRLVGLLGWLWIVVQAFAGGSSDADVASLFLWVYGWVGVALLSALVGPVWFFIDPFSTLHDIIGALGRRLGLRGAAPQPYPVALGIWPAVAGFGFFVWLELVGRVEGGRTLSLVMIGYTLIALAGMFYFGRDTWRRQADVFGVWFGLLGRLAPYALDGPPEAGIVRRRAFGAGLTEGGWNRAQLVLLTLGTGAIIYDGLSQTEIYYQLFGRPDFFGQAQIALGTLLAGAFMAAVLALALGVAMRVGTAATGAGLLPVAVGYLVAHYIVFLLVEGQRIVHALNDPLQQGDNLLPFDLGFYEPVLFLPTALVWTVQLAAVVGGHVLGAWAGHLAMPGGATRRQPLRQVPLAALMVLFTSVTLWSLGQAVLMEPEARRLVDGLAILAR